MCFDLPSIRGEKTNKFYSKYRFNTYDTTYYINICFKRVISKMTTSVINEQFKRTMSKHKLRRRLS